MFIHSRREGKTWYSKNAHVYFGGMGERVRHNEGCVYVSPHADDVVVICNNAHTLQSFLQTQESKLRETQERSKTLFTSILERVPMFFLDRIGENMVQVDMNNPPLHTCYVGNGNNYYSGKL